MKLFRNLLFPDPPRVLPHARALNIAARTAHIIVTGALFGGHVFNVDKQRLWIWLIRALFDRQDYLAAFVRLGIRISPANSAIVTSLSESR